MIHLLAHRLGLLCILDAQTGILAYLALITILLAQFKARGIGTGLLRGTLLSLL